MNLLTWIVGWEQFWTSLWSSWNNWEFTLINQVGLIEALARIGVFWTFKFTLK